MPDSRQANKSAPAAQTQVKKFTFPNAPQSQIYVPFLAVLKVGCGRAPYLSQQVAEKSLLTPQAEVVAAAAQPMQVFQQQYWGWWPQKERRHCVFPLALLEVGSSVAFVKCTVWCLLCSLQSVWPISFCS